MEHRLDNEDIREAVEYFNGEVGKGGKITPGGLKIFLDRVGLAPNQNDLLDLINEIDVDGAGFGDPEALMALMADEIQDFPLSDESEDESSQDSEPGGSQGGTNAADDATNSVSAMPEEVSQSKQPPAPVAQEKDHGDDEPPMNTPNPSAYDRDLENVFHFFAHRKFLPHPKAKKTPDGDGDDEEGDNEAKKVRSIVENTRITENGLRLIVEAMLTTKEGGPVEKERVNEELRDMFKELRDEFGAREEGITFEEFKKLVL